MKICTKCKKQQPLDNFYNNKNHKEGKHFYCKSCSRDYDKKRYASKLHTDVKNYYLKRNYNITLKDYKNHLEYQKNKCKICKSKTSNNKSHSTFSVDHCHKTGKVRGLLCDSCNRGLGFFKDNEKLLSMAAEYIKKEGNI